MNKTLVVGLIALLVGGFLGSRVNSSKFIEGRLSGCNDIMDTINRGTGADMVCVIDSGEVFVTLKSQPEVRMGLDGSIRR